MQKVEIEENRGQRSSKDGHGIGLSNVQGVVEKCDGNFAISCDEKEFVAVVII
ncbi:MAG: GHKL domain-containing protein [Lachnospiraceae bacterium]|nr:GHKL domain-containing protein [Lachnospiraceae bacterium]